MAGLIEPRDANSGDIERLRRRHIAVLAVAGIALYIAPGLLLLSGGFFIRSGFMLGGALLAGYALLALRLDRSTDLAGTLGWAALILGVWPPIFFNPAFTDPRPILSLTIIAVWGLAFLGARRSATVAAVTATFTVAALYLSISGTSGDIPTATGTRAVAVIVCQLFAILVGLYLFANQSKATLKALASLVRAQELALAHSQSAIDIADIGSFEIDLRTGKHSVNQRYRDLLQMPESQYPTITLEALRERITEQQAQIIVERIANRQPIEAIEDHVQLPSGEELYLSTKGRAVSAAGEDYYIGAILDVTEQVTRSKTLMSAYQDLERTCEVTHTGLGEINLTNGAVTANAVWRKMFGFDLDEPLDLSKILERLPAYERESATAFIQRVASNTGPNSIDYDFITRDGDTRRIRAVAAVAPQQSNDTIIKAAESDITDLYQQQLEITNQSEQQRKLFRIVAHELRTPAAAIQMLVNEMAIPLESQIELASLTNHLLNVIDDLRIAVSPDTDIEIRMQTFELSRLLQEVERQTSHLVKAEGMSLNIIGCAECHDVFVSDAYRIRSALTNLVRNSAYHSEGSSIEVVATVEQRADEALLTFAVKDDGKGINTDDIDRLFEPFERGDSVSSGTGVGLYLVRNWIDKLGGTVSYHPNQPRGACFTIELTVNTGALASQRQAPSHSVDFLEAKSLMADWHILVAEDDPVLRKATQTLLKRQFGIRAATARDGAEALKAASETHFDLIISDYFMPNIDGRELTQRLRAQESEAIIICLTAATIGDERYELIAAGADAVIFKPLDIEEFAATLLDIVAVRRANIA